MKIITEYYIQLVDESISEAIDSHLSPHSTYSDAEDDLYTQYNNKGRVIAVTTYGVLDE